MTDAPVSLSAAPGLPRGQALPDRRDATRLPASKIVSDHSNRWHVTRFVTRTLCHVVIPHGRGETVASPGGLVTWDVTVWVRRCETAACRLITQISKYGAKKPRSEEVTRWHRVRSSQADLGVSHVDMRSRKRGRRIAFNCVSPSAFPRYLT